MHIHPPPPPPHTHFWLSPERSKCNHSEAVTALGRTWHNLGSIKPLSRGLVTKELNRHIRQFRQKDGYGCGGGLRAELSVTISINAINSQFLKSKTNVCKPTRCRYHYQGLLMEGLLFGSEQNKKRREESCCWSRLPLHCWTINFVKISTPEAAIHSPIPYPNKNQQKAKPTEEEKITAQQGPVRHVYVRAARQTQTPIPLPQKQQLFQPLIAERCNSDKQKMGVKFPNPQKLKVGKILCAGANPLSAIKLLDLLKLS